MLIGENNEQLKGHILHTERSYTNFVVELEVRWSGEIDSGVMFREPELQVQFGISRSLKKDMTGAFYLAKHPINPKGRLSRSRPHKGHRKNFRRMAGTNFASRPRATPSPSGSTASRSVNTPTRAYAGGAPHWDCKSTRPQMKVEFRNIRAAAPGLTGGKLGAP